MSRACRVERLRARLCSRRSARVAAWLHCEAALQCLWRPVFGHRLRDPGAAYAEHNGEQRDPLDQRPGCSRGVAVQRSDSADWLHQLAVAAVLLVARQQLRVQSSTSRRCRARVACCRRAVHQALGFAAAHDTGLGRAARCLRLQTHRKQTQKAAHLRRCCVNTVGARVGLQAASYQASSLVVPRACAAVSAESRIR